MKRLWTVLIIMAVVVAVTGLSVGCKDKTSYEITFDIGDYNAEQLPTLVVKKGQSILEPDVDSSPRVGYKFVWYTDPERTEIFDFDSPIKSNLSLYLGEEGLTYSLTYDVDEAWFDISSLPTQYRAGEVISLPEPKNNAPTKGFHPGNWHVGSRDIGYEINEEEVGDLVLTFVANPIEYMVTYTNIDRIDLVDYKYLEYVNNDNPQIYKVTDGIVTLQSLTLKEDCPYPHREFSHWEKVAKIGDLQGEVVEELNINMFFVSMVYLRAIWVSID